MTGSAKRFPYIRDVWPAAALLALVLVPTTCILWFMLEAVSNERLAVRQKLVEVYGTELREAAEALEADWRARLDLDDAKLSPAEVFVHLVDGGVCEGAVVYDASGRVAYPSDGMAAAAPLPRSWRDAERLEFERGDYAAAAEAYVAVAEASVSVTVKARALMAQARCLQKQGERNAAVGVLRSLTEEPYREVVDERGGRVSLNAALRALQLVPRDEWQQAELSPDALVARLRAYDGTPIASSQRRFLMRELMALLPDGAAFPTFVAENLSAQYVESNLPAPNEENLSPSGLPDVLHIAQTTPSGNRVVLLFGALWVEEDAAALLTSQFGDAAVARLSAPDTSGEDGAFALQSLGAPLAGWQLALHLQGTDPFEAAAQKQIAAYLWTGLLVVVVLTVLALAASRYVARQLRLTRLKNELIATVSHELKTPLASTRVLVDTLLEGRAGGPEQEREYLDLVARENARLTHLVDNFLTFSRMERDKGAFTFEAVRVEDLVSDAVHAAGQRFQEPACKLDIDVAADLPPVLGDRDALVTVLLNLLDNAHKYSRNGCRIAVRANRDGEAICIEVEDNGIGMTRRAARRAFERFYQVDQRLARNTGGCGLGLSIVDFIVKAHSGAVEVESELGKGSTFTVHLPVAGANE
jgi:two-component system, OmpR family, phosphate regulon sensor histidine kinase PhoR